MKVLIVNAYDNLGGAARASYRLHQSLLVKGINSSMLVQNKFGDDFTVEKYTNSAFQNILEKIRAIADNLPVKLYKRRTKTLFSPAWIGFNNLVNQINSSNADLVHLHWISNGMMKIEDLARITIPIVWTLHDNWAFTGGCHIMWECEKYKKQCGSCPRLGSTTDKDLSRRIFNRKKNTYKKLPKMLVVGLSKWITNCTKESVLLKDHEIVNIPNPIDTNIFKPLNTIIARDLWNLPTDKKLVLFGAMSAVSDINKGFKELIQSLDLLDDQNIEFVIFGSSQPKDKQPFKFKTHYLGLLHDDVSLVSLYSAVDLMVVPSLQETLPQTASEAMSCGTPVVAFGHTGLLDIIEHKKTGYLAKPYDVNDLASGIEWVLYTKNYDELCVNARKKIVREFDSSMVADSYIELYKKMISDCK
jgi:glycosyltransferase involved in cell wall biosynthesis